MTQNGHVPDSSGISVLATDDGHEATVPTGITVHSLAHGLTRLIHSDATLREVITHEDPAGITLIFRRGTSTKPSAPGT